MNFSQICKSYSKYIILGLQAFILLTAVFSWMLHRGNAYNRVFTLDEYTLSGTAIAAEDVSIDELGGQAGVFLSTPALSLEKGIYQIQVDYNVDRPGSVVSVSSSLGAMECIAPPLELNPDTHSAAMTLELSRNADDVYIEASFSGSGFLSITNMAVNETSGRYKKNIFHAFLLCLLISLGYCFKRSDVPARKIMLALSGIFLLTCYPLYTDYLMPGHDIPFHLLRIDAVSEGLSAGTFPVKLHPLWAKGHGYAIGILYGDAFLYFPAFLRLLGFSIQSAYKYFAAAVNLGTVLISYYSFRKMFSDKKLGVLGSLAYTLAPYRLVDMYTRASVGEYTAMMFLPLVFCGFYLILKETSEEPRWKPVLLTAFGLTGLIQSHVLSCLMTGFVMILVCILSLKRLLRPRVFFSLASAAALTLALNLCFIVPFLDFYQEEIQIFSPDWTGRAVGSFQDKGLFPIQLFTLFQRSNGGTWASTAGIYNEFTLGIGIFLTIGIFLFLYLLCVHRREMTDDSNYYPALLCMVLGGVLLYMCTCYFPWDALASLSEGLDHIIGSLQFPWRLLAPATVLLTFVLCYSWKAARKSFEKYYPSLLVGSLILLAVNCGWYFYDYCYTQEPYRIYNTYELNTMALYSYDYLPNDTDPEAIQESAVVMKGTASIQAYHKLGTTVTCTVSSGTEGGAIEFPLLYYKYYRCTDTDTAQAVSIGPGANHVVRVELPADYTGTIQIRFVEPWFWRLAEVISLLTLAAVSLLIFRYETKKYFKKM